jgi:nucleotide-binding universal stress UspA family protein
MFKKILIPIDGSDAALRAVGAGCSLAREVNAEVVFVHAIVPFIAPYAAEFDFDGRVRDLFEKAAHEANEKFLNAASDIAVRHEVKHVCVSDVSPRPETLINRVCNEQHCDLIVIATHGRGALSRLVMGSVTTRLVNHAPVPLLIYRDQIHENE